MDFSIEAAGSIATAVATVALVFLLYRTVKQLEATVEVSRIQTEYRFRPWIGHVGAIKKIEDSMNENRQFDITIKNFGELPASKVTVKFVMSKNILKRNEIKTRQNQFDLGPMLPNMEKHYWFFIPSDVWKKAEEGKERLFTGLFFNYLASGKESGYGMISEYDPSSHNFVHKDMWIDDTKLQA